jgi:hypothetical protein
MKFAYADPPYLGQAKRHYSHDPNAREVNHHVLIGYLDAEFDAWALSLSSPTLKQILNLCPDDVRVCPWVKPFASFKPGVRRAYAWEPIIVRGGRAGTREDPTVRDWVSANITLKRGLSGAKPQAVCWWLFDFVGLQPDDEFHDVFPGSGAVSRAWEAWRDRHSEGRAQLALEATP